MTKPKDVALAHRNLGRLLRTRVDVVSSYRARPSSLSRATGGPR